MSPRFLALAVLLVCALGVQTGLADDGPDFATVIRPILARNCFSCHGPDDESREADLRLDTREGATAELLTGAVAVVPGDAKTSELVARVTTDDESLRMPPPDSGHNLSAAEAKLLQEWINAGAKYAKHWSFVKPVRPALPSVKQPDWPRNAIDYFTLAAMEQRGLSPESDASRYAIIRRLSLDLRGLPPSREEVESFVRDNTPGAYDRLVDRFLADPAFGQRWAALWLDLARYADSAGYGSDPLRTIWPFRDWTINALNANQPFDEFTIDQLAGDLRPNPSPEQLVATAFHRNTMTNTEGGTDDEEFRVAAVKDRVDTTLQVWMGLTMGCAKCHNHKYDPIAQEEYYETYAIFNQTEDADRNNESPTMPYPTTAITRVRASYQDRIDQLTAKLGQSTPEIEQAQTKWEAATLVTLDQSSDRPIARFVRIELPGKSRMLSLAEVQVFAEGKNIAPSGSATQSSVDYNGPPKLAIDGNTDGHYFNAKSTTHTKTENNPWWEVDLGKVASIERVIVWNRTDGNVGSRLNDFHVVLLDENRKPVFKSKALKPPQPSLTVQPTGGVQLPNEIQSIVELPTAKRTPQQVERLAKYYREITPLLDPVRNEIASLKKQMPALPTVPVLRELPGDKRRKTFLMLKGNFLSPGPEVGPNVPAEFALGMELDGEWNRLALARWLVHPDNPLTARVTANRFWAQFFGRGLVVTEEDFGTQGEIPSHPELLDWLATELVRTGWDLKAFMRTIVTSATYRQSSQITSEKQAHDPSNQWYSRGPRFRLKAEMVRDQALQLSGLLARKIGGPSVFPPQPPGLWRAAFNGRDRKWATSTGLDRYRRGIYTFWRRTVPYPAMATFDAPSREICNIRRIRTNTPLQAFVTMNDPAYVEMSQALGRRIWKNGATVRDRLKFGLELCLVRPSTEAELQTLKELYSDTLATYKSQPQEATKLATDPLGPLPNGLAAPEAAAWTVVGNVLLNLDAVMMKD
ncbi:DUF1553 domain-containing protein [Thalassoroseus pseudoceratinae]|uniref:DUF1553 domain-containing protein n=1 Tax=Thalassoroseus pseudoceratinae TaxID=2713176 RepID=UPI0019813CCB|nr:DUF1553 domain-containing protein [Thalassoroseus pseudoceratinae]